MEKVTPDLLSGMPLPTLEGESDKESRGRVLVIGGGREMPGAPLLTGLAAYRVGAGKVQLAAAPALVVAMGIAFLEARVIPVAANEGEEPGPGAARDLEEQLKRCDAIAVGPGMLDEASAADLMVALSVAETAASFVVDAAALVGLKGREAELRSLAGRLIFTPHAGEMAAFTGLTKEEVQADPAETAREVARTWSAVVALKGRDTYIASPDGRVWLHEGGVSGLGVSGSGDVLAGAIAGLLARGAAPVTATLWGVFAHARAGRALGERIGRLGFLAREVADELPHQLDG
jgi:ADP-dependent NAD(P)H-hydrate dehydratase